MKGELEALGEDAEGVENISKIQGQILNLTHGKVNIFGDDGQFKSTYDIMMDIADVWKELSSIEQADLLETIAGKHQANNAAALIQNAENAKEMVKVGLDAEGSAAEENARFVDSLQGRLNSLMASFQSFSSSVLDSSLLKGLISGLTGVLNILTSISETIGTLPTLIGAAGAAFAIFGKGKMFKGGLFDFGSNKKNGKSGISGIVDDIKAMTSAVSEFNAMRKTDGLFNAGMGMLLKNDKNNPFDKQFKIIEAQRKKFEQYQDLRKGGNGRNQMSVANAIQQSFDIDDTSLIDSIRKYDNDFDFDKYAEGQMKMVTANEANKKSLKSQNRIVNAATGEYKKYGVTVDSVTQTLNDPKLVDNPVLTGYINKGDFSKGIKGLVGANAKSILKSVGGSLLGGLVGGFASAGISLAISGVISGIDWLINYNKNLSEEVDNATTAYNDQKKVLSETKGTIDEISPRYAKLAKGVNSITNENENLTTEEYEEYLSITSQIAEMFPSMVKGYDAQGNAVLKYAGNVEELNKAYEKQLKSNNDELLGKSNKVFSDYENEKAKLKYDSDTIKDLKGLLEDTDGRDISKFISDITKNGSNDITQLVSAIQDAGFDKKAFETNENFLKRVFEEDPSVVNGIVADYENQISDITKQMRDITEAYVSNAFLDGKYKNISEQTKNVLSQMIPNFDDEYFAEFDSVHDLNKSIDGILSSFNKLDSEKKATFEAAFDLETKFNNGDISVGEYMSSLNNVENIIDGMDIDENAKKQLKLSFKIDDNDIVKQYNNLEKQLVKNGIGKTAAKELLKGLNSSELEAAVQIVAEGEIDFSKVKDGGNVDELLEQIKNKAKVIEAINFSVDISVEAEGLTKVNAALSEMKTATGLTAESMDSLKGRYKELPSYDPTKLFEATAHGIRANTTELNRLEKAYTEQSKSDVDAHLKSLSDEYENLRAQMKNCDDAAKYSELYNDSESIRVKINEIAEYGSQLDGLMSKYKAWQDTESAGNDRDMYESILSGFNTVKEEINRGWWDDGTAEYLELLTGRDLSTRDIDAMRDAYASLDKTIGNTGYTIKDFFTANKEGASTNNGVYNFLNTVESFEKQFNKDFVKRNTDGNIIGFDIDVDGKKALAQAMGISEELVDIIVRASEDAGFVVNMDGTYTNLQQLQDEATAAAKKLKDEFKKTEYEFNLSSNTVEGAGGLREQADEAKKIIDGLKQEDGSVVLDMDAAGYKEGTQEAITLATTLQTKLNLLEHSHYVNLNTDNVEKELQKPIEKIEEWEEALRNKNLAEITGDTDGVEKYQKQMDDVVEYLDDLDPTVKTALEIDNLTQEEIEAGLEDGTIKIPAQIDFMSDINDNLELLLKKQLVDAGLYNKEDFEKEVKVKWDVEADDRKAKETMGKVSTDLENFMLDNEFTGEEITITASVLGMVDVEKLKTAVDGMDDKQVEAIVKAMGEGDVNALNAEIDALDPKTVQAICEAFGFEGVDDLKTSIQQLNPKVVQAIAQALGGGGVDELRDRVSGLTDKTVTALAKALGGPDVANLKNEMATAQDKEVTFTVHKKTIFETIGNAIGGAVNTVKGFFGHGADGTAHVTGTSHAHGTAFARGDWRTKKTETALTGELGQELVVTRDNQWFTVGDNGAEFANIPRGSIVFNHRQTEELFKNGYVTAGGGRGRAYLSGTGGAGPAGGGYKPMGGGSSSSSNKSKSKSSSSSSSSDSKANEEAKEFEETLDFIETLIDRVERAIKRLDTVASSSFRSWSERTSALNDQIAETSREIGIQQQGYDRYMSQANGVGLDAGWAQKVRDGAVDISTIKDEDLANKIKEYQEW